MYFKCDPLFLACIFYTFCCFCFTKYFHSLFPPNCIYTCKQNEWSIHNKLAINVKYIIYMVINSDGPMIDYNQKSVGLDRVELMIKLKVKAYN